MAEIGEIINFNLGESDPQYHLVGDQMVHGNMFTNYTVSAIEKAEAGQVRHVLNLADVKGVLPEIDALIDGGWQEGVFIGKLMTSSDESEQTEIEDTEKSDKKSMSADKIRELAKKKSGFTTGLFVVQPILTYSNSLSDIADSLPTQAIPHLVAGIHQDGTRSVRIIPANNEELPYNEHYGESIRDLDVLNPDIWEAIEALHDKLYGQAVDLIIAAERDSATELERI